MKTAPRPKATQPPPPKATRRPSSLIIALCLLALIGAGGYGLWSWHQQTRPGMVHYRRGEDDAAAGRFREAEQEWKLGVAQDPTFPDCYERLGDLYENTGDYPGAVENYSAAAKLRPRDADLLEQLTAAYVGEGETHAALPVAKRAAALLPDDPKAVGTYGDLAQQVHDRGDALPVLRRAHQLDPVNPRYVLELASTEMDLLRFDDAERDLTGYLQGRPDDPWANYLMAVIYNQKPRTPDTLRAALSYAERSRDAGQAPVNTYLLLAQLLLAAHRNQDARTAAQSALKLTPNNPDALSLLATADTRLGQTQEAEQVSARLAAETRRHDRIDHLRHVMGFNNADITHGLELAALTEDDGDKKAAETYYVALVREAPHDPRTHAALASFLRRTGRPKLARQVANINFVP